MYALRNRVQLIGNLGQNPEISTFESGRKKATFSMATSERYRNAQGEQVTETQWHNIVAWGKMADVAERMLAKGREVVVEGKLVSRTYTDKQGQQKLITEVVVNELLPINRKGAE